MTFSLSFQLFLRFLILLSNRSTRRINYVATRRLRRLSCVVSLCEFARIKFSRKERKNNCFNEEIELLNNCGEFFFSFFFLFGLIRKRNIEERLVSRRWWKSFKYDEDRGSRCYRVASNEKNMKVKGHVSRERARKLIIKVRDVI